jgi:hypothetical protein
MTDFRRSVGLFSPEIRHVTRVDAGVRRFIVAPRSDHETLGQHPAVVTRQMLRHFREADVIED